MRYLTWQESLTVNPFTAIIDVRSPAEFALSHIPGAVNLPVLNDAQRAEVGRLYCQVSRFDARRLGAAMVAANMAHHLETWFAAQPGTARFLIYCWRGGQRSRSMATILHAVGWNVSVVSGGYKNYRSYVRGMLVSLIPRLSFQVLGGLTGSGKTLVLRQLAASGAQALDLEALGCHRGSLFGDEPGSGQPSQKQFESRILSVLERFDPARPVWVEGESKRLGRLLLPEPLWQAMIRAPLHEIEVPLPARARFLNADYPHLHRDPEALRGMLKAFREPCGGREVARWEALIGAGDWTGFAVALLEGYYDPVYRRHKDYPPPVAVYAMPQVTAETARLQAARLRAAAGIL